jgi:hypothetical protein
MVLSNFQPTYLAAVAVGAAGVAAAFARTPGGDGRPRRIALAGTVVLALPAAALLALPGLHEALVYAAHWFVRGEEFQRHVAELLPLFAMRGTLDPTFAIQRFGVVFLLFPIVWGRVAFLSWRRRSAPLALLALWSLVFFVLTLDQNRFGNTLVVAYAVSLGGVVAETWAALRAERPTRKSLRVGVWVALALLALATVDSIVGFYRPRLAHALVALRDDGVRRAGPLSPRHRLFDRAARWMASGTPPTRGYLDTSLAPQYGVLCNWGVGHLVRYRSERPMVQDNFGVYGGRGTWEAAWRYYATPDEEEAVAILDRLGARYVMADFQGAGATRAAPWNSMIRLLYGNYGAETELPDGRLLPALSHHRLVFHAHTDARRDRGGPLRAEAPHRSIGVWERVAGARVTGRAEPGARVTARLDLETSRGRRHVYVIGTTADAGGVWSLVVPYSNGPRFSSAVRVGEHYRLESAGNAATFVVSEQAVKRGLRVEGPDLRPDPDATGP